MIRFLGNIEAKADAKGRVFIPAQFRRQLQSGSEDKLIMRKDVFKTAWCSIRKRSGMKNWTNFGSD